ncbi:MAG: hypothetical protein K1060chlam2_00256 [Chlamydiae bacterium]|nr:hypothetical protein [Chlamydiota bacterium]
MDFTREPLVETVITPKEGYKLILRASSGNSQEEYSVNAVEVVSFGKSFFFRSLEKPKAFLLPMTEYEVVEARETRTVLKKPQIEKPIKISGGRKVASKSAKSREPKQETPKEEPKKRERKRPNRRRTKAVEKETAEEKTTEKADEAPQVRRTLLPPPTSLISEQIDRYKNYLADHRAVAPEKSESKVEELKTEKEESPTLPFVPEPPPAEEEKVVDIKEKAHVPPEENDS